MNIVHLLFGSGPKPSSPRRSAGVQWEPLESRRLLSTSVTHTIGTPPQAPLTATRAATSVTATGVTLNIQTGQPFSHQLGTLTGISRRGLHANVNWGDGTPVVRGFIFTNRSGTLTVSASHNYVRPGTFVITVKVWHGSGRRATLVAQFQSTANVQPGTTTLQPVAGEPFTTTVGSFVPPANGNGMTQALINWGDGQMSDGTIQPNAQGGQDVVGTHTYSRPGNYRITAFVTQSNGFSLMHVATLTSFASVAANAASLNGSGSTPQSILPMM